MEKTQSHSESTRPATRHPFIHLIEQYWLRGLLLVIALYFLVAKDVTVRLDMESVDGPSGISGRSNPVHLPEGRDREGKASADGVEKKGGDQYANLAFILNPTYASRKGISDAIVKQKLDNCLRYVGRYEKVALAEMKKYGIPASITLAQGLLESDAGHSDLAQESDNHFGIKCRRKCRGCTCRNYSDDDIYDMFRVFDSVWESYREHSLLLNGSRYRHLLKLDKTDYKAWAHGLKKAGYATDKRYAEKLIQIIEALKLYRYDS